MRVMILQVMKGVTRGQIETNRAVPWHGWRSLQILAGCVAVLSLDGWEDARGCHMEHAACEGHGV